MFNIQCMVELGDIVEGTASVEQYQKMGYIGLRMGIESGQITDPAAVKVMAKEEIKVLEGNRAVFEPYWGPREFNHKLDVARQASTEESPYYQATYCIAKRHENEFSEGPEGKAGAEWRQAHIDKSIKWLNMEKKLMAAGEAYTAKKIADFDKTAAGMKANSTPVPQ